MPVRHEFSSGFGREGPIRIEKEVGLRAMVCIVADIPRIRAKWDVRYLMVFEFCVNIALLRHPDYIDPPRVLNENTLIPLNVIRDKCSSRTSSWGGKCCNGSFDDVVVGFVNTFTPRDGDD